MHNTPFPRFIQTIASPDGEPVRTSMPGSKHRQLRRRANPAAELRTPPRYARSLATPQR
jgi:hypothetical protein